MRRAGPGVRLALLLAGTPAAGLGLDPGKALTQYNLDSWTTESGLPQNTVTSVVQTRDGYLWVGSFGGLARFDGVRFVVHDRASSPALRNSGIHVLLPDKDGGLWAGTNGGGLTYLNGSQARTYTTGDGLAGDVVRALHQDARGRLWVGTNGGLSLLEGGALRSWQAADGFSDGVVRAIREDARGTLWIGTNGDGLYRYRDGAFERLTTRDGLPGDSVFSLAFDAQGGLWVGTNGGGLARYANGRFRRYGPREGLSGDIIWTLSVDRHGSLWAGTYGAGLFRLEGEVFRGLDTRRGLTSDFVRALWQDHEGSLWIGTNTGGLARLRDGKFTTYSALDGLPSDVAKTVLADPAGGLWIGTSGGGLARLRDGSFSRFARAQGLPHDFVQSLLVDRAGALWVGTNGGGLARLENGRFRVLGRRDGLADDHVAALSEAPDGALWIGTTAGGLSHYKDGRFTTYTKRNGLGADLVLATLVDRGGALWVGTDGGGLSRFEGGVFRTFTVAEGLAADSVLSLYEDAQGVLWIGTSGGGLSVYREGRMASLSTRDGLHDDVVFAIVEDARGALWLSGNRGLSRLDKAAALARAAGGSVRLAPAAFGIADGMKSNECSGVSQPAAARLDDGRLAFPSTRGIVLVDPDRLAANPVAPPVHVEELIAGGRSRPGPLVELEPGASSWEIRFTALSLLAPEKVRFRYRLHGLDEDWVGAADRRSAFYSHVPPGDYVFEVRAANNDGVWNDAGARLPIRLAPRFRETRWFAGLAGLGLVLLGAFGYALRVRGLEAHRAELARQVEERTRALAEERQRAELAREEAERLRAQAERQQELAQRANAVKTEMLSIVAHDLKNPLQLVLGHAEMAQLQLGQRKPADEFLGHIQQAAQRMLGILTSLLDAAAMESGEIALARERVDLRPLVRRVVASIEPAAARKGQRLELAAEEALLVQGDAERLVEIVENLVGNAVKYSPPGAPIRVAVRRDGPRALVEVSDAGPGLSEDDKRRLFGRFQRLSAKPTGGESSTGLGLSIAHRLARLMDGELLADSAGPGRGSRFTLAMPVVE